MFDPKRFFQVAATITQMLDSPAVEEESESLEEVDFTQVHTRQVAHLVYYSVYGTALLLATDRGYDYKTWPKRREPKGRVPKSSHECLWDWYRQKSGLPTSFLTSVKTLKAARIDADYHYDIVMERSARELVSVAQSTLNTLIKWNQPEPDA